MLFVLFLVLMLAMWRITELEPEVSKEVQKPKGERLAVDRLLQAAPPAVARSAERAPTKLPQICPAYLKALEGAELRMKVLTETEEPSAVLGFGASMRGAPACLLTASLLGGVLQLREQEPGKEEPGRVLLSATSKMELWSGEHQRGELLGTMEALPLSGPCFFDLCFFCLLSRCGIAAEILPHLRG